MYSHIERGALNTMTYRIYFKDENGPISPVHDIPLWVNEEKNIFNMIVEIPRWTNPKMEMKMKESLNPIMQEIQGGKLRYAPNVFPHHGCIWNYGAFPQTFENPDVEDEATKKGGDGDPLDALEIGYKVGKVGEVRKVKVLGAIALIDQGETDWKVFAIDITDPLAEHMKDIGDIEKQYNGLFEASVNWFRVYKMNLGKQENKFAFGGKPKDKDFTVKLVKSAHLQWKDIVLGKAQTTHVDCTNVTIKKSPFHISTTEAEDIVSKSPLPAEAQPIDPSANHWFYYELAKKKKKS